MPLYSSSRFGRERCVSHLSTRSGLVTITRPAVRIETIAEELTNPRFTLSTTGDEIKEPIS